MISTLIHEVFNMPVWYLFTWFYARIVNFNLVALSALSVFTTCVGIVFLFLCGCKLHGKIFGAIAATICAISIFFYGNNLLSQIRPYGFVFMFSTMVLYFYLANKKKLFFTFLTILCLTHWCSAFMALFYAILSTKNIKNLSMYFIPFVPMFIWAIICLSFGHVTKYWTEPQWIYEFSPTLSSIFGFEITGGAFGYFIVAIYFALFISGAIFARGKMKIVSFAVLFYYFSVLLVSVIGPICLYWVRYFTLLLPHFYLVIAFGFYKGVLYASRIRS